MPNHPAVLVTEQAKLCSYREPKSATAVMGLGGSILLQAGIPVVSAVVEDLQGQAI